LDINAVIYGLIYLFYEPNPDDPLNREAADLYRNDKAQVRLSRTPVAPRVCGESVATAGLNNKNNILLTRLRRPLFSVFFRFQFARVVKRTLQGMSHGGESFPKLL
jgi:hypothetical protein